MKRREKKRKEHQQTNNTSSKYQDVRCNIDKVSCLYDDVVEKG